MKIVEPYARLVYFKPEHADMGSLQGQANEPMEWFSQHHGRALLRKIEWCGRISHRSEEAMTPESWKRFIPATVMGHGDWSIVEHASVSVDFLVDRGITHEIVRHRLFSFTQECVSGDTRLTPSLTIRDAYATGAVGRKIKSSDGVLIVKNKISHIFKKGIQPVYSVVTKSGYRIKTTLAHEFQIPSGEFVRLESLRSTDHVMVNGRPCLLRINDTALRKAFFEDGLCPEEIAKKEGVSYAAVTRRLRKIGVASLRRNDKNTWKYNRNHTASSYAKMRKAITDGYRNGRKVWNKVITEGQSASVQRQGDALRTTHHSNGFKENNSNWKGGVAKTARNEARRKKIHIKACEVCLSTDRLEVHHIDENPKNNADENLIKLCYVCHRKVHSAFKLGVSPVADEISSILFAGVEEVYDLEMQTHHNYVANGFVVHNSTRFVNYEKKMPPSFIRPVDLKPVSISLWEVAISRCEETYRQLLADGCTPQIARSVFPNALASRLLTTGNLRNWRHFLIMRTTKEAHPQMRQVTIPLLEEFQAKIPLLFDDIKPLARQVDNLKLPR